MFETIKGLKVHYEVHGKGQPIVLLHGWGTELRLFDSVVSYLKKSNTVYTLDFPGFGLSQEPDTPWSVYDYADFTEAFLDSLDIKNPALMGHSFGGRISIILGARRKIKKIILVDSAGIRPKRKARYYIKVYTYKTMKHLIRIPGLRVLFGDLFDAYRSKAGSADYRQASDMMRKILSNVVSEDLQHFMKDIQAPTLLVWGSEDRDTPVSDGKIMEEKIKDAALIVFEGAGHYSYLERPHDFQAIVESFMKEDSAHA